MNINPTEVVETTTLFIKNIFERAKVSKAILGVSGGIDSAVSLKLVTRALGHESVYPYLLPYGSLNQQGVDDALLVIHHCLIPRDNIVTINIQPFVDTFVSWDPTLQGIRKGNIMARLRMMFLFDAAKKLGGLVVGTENKTEHYLGYYTRFGDEASDLEPLRSLYKTQVYQLAQFLDIPDPLIKKAPTAGLWEGQTDEKEFGFRYKEADEILYYYLDQHKTEAEIAQMNISLPIIRLVLSRMEAQSFKQVLPYVNELTL